MAGLKSADFKSVRREPGQTGAIQTRLVILRAVAIPAVVFAVTVPVINFDIRPSGVLLLKSAERKLNARANCQSLLLGAVARINRKIFQ